MRKAPLLAILLLSGCDAWETVGVVSTQKFNLHIDEVEGVTSKGFNNQAKIAGVTKRLVENELDIAKANNDNHGIEMFSKEEEKIRQSIEDAEELAKTKFSRPREGGLLGVDWESLIKNILGFLVGIVATYFGLSPKISRLTSKAVQFAQSTEKNDISKDKDLANKS